MSLPTNKDDDSSSILIFTDGACSGNPGPGGWGSIMAMPDGTVQELGGGAPATTNNRMEMAAAIHSLAKLEPPAQPAKIKLYTDSSYLIKGITQWIWGWRSRGWKNAEGKDVANRELWEELLRHVTRLKPATIEWKYVRGHAGNPGNERCDFIAVAFATGKREQLYIGPRDGYFIDLSVLPDEEPVPEQKKTASTGSRSGSSSARSSGAPSGPTTYLSYHAGILKRHSTWAECERHVKGQSNAKFKKVKSVDEERLVLQSWGLDPSSLSD